MERRNSLLKSKNPTALKDLKNKTRFKSNARKI